MATVIRLKRMGAKKHNVMRIVVTDSRSPRDGRFIEEIGSYDTTTDPATVNIKEERAKYWLTVGAQTSDTVKSILKNKGIKK